jgi:hypothetical protein
MPPGAPRPHPHRLLRRTRKPKLAPIDPCTELYGSTEEQLAQTARRGYRGNALGSPQGGFPLRERHPDRIAKVDVEGSSPFTRSQACNRRPGLRLLRFWGSGWDEAGRPGPPARPADTGALPPDHLACASPTADVSYVPAWRPISERHAPGADASASLRGAEANEADAASAVPD